MFSWLNDLAGTNSNGARGEPTLELPSSGASRDDIGGILSGLSGLVSEVATTVNAFTRKTPAAKPTVVAKPGFNFSASAPVVIGGIAVLALLFWFIKKH